MARFHESQCFIKVVTLLSFLILVQILVAELMRYSSILCFYTLSQPYQQRHRFLITELLYES